MKKHARLLAATIFSILAGCGASPQPVETAEPPEEGPELQPDPHAEVIVFVMARCPHCADLLETLLPIKRELGDSMAIALAYVAGPGMAGDAEVEAASMELCVGMSSTTDQWFDFLECVYSGKKWRSLPKGWTGCATEAGIDVAAVTRCIDDGTGEAELERSAGMAMAQGIRAAPTMFIDGRPYVGDRSAKDILARVCYMAGSEETRPEACDEVDPPPEIPATLLTDRRCDDPSLCDVSREVEFLGEMLPTMRLIELDFGDPAGLELYELILSGEGPRSLPLLIIDGALDEFEGERESMAEYLLEFGEGYVMPLGRGWDPLAEICDNGTDDNGDGVIDCDDDGCAPTLVCRAEAPRKLDLFVMSRCPFGMELLPSVGAFLDHMGRDRKKVDFTLRFIGDVLPDGTLDSMHGDLELEEDLRMVCAQDLYPERYRFMDYVNCRAEAYVSKDWEACVPKGMSARKIEKCATGERGAKLLAESFELSDATGLVASPTWLLNDKFEMEGRTAKAILEAFCERNDMPRCAEEIEDVVRADGEGPSDEQCL